MLAVYIVCILLTIVLAFWYFLVDVRRGIVQNVMLLAMLIANLGYFSLAISKDLTGVIFSYRLVYIGACYLPLLFALTVCELCGYKIKAVYRTIMVLIQTCIFGLVCTIGYSDIYYKAVGFEISNGITKIVKVYGKLHFLHPMMMYIYLFGSMVMAIVACRKRKNVDYREIRLLILFEAIASLAYVAQTPLGLPMDITPIVYILLMTDGLIPLYRSNIYYVVENEKVIAEQLSKVGFITFDHKLKFKGANEYATLLFPALEKGTIGKALDPVPEKLKNNLLEVEAFLGNKNKTKGYHRETCSTIKIGRRTYSTAVHTLHDFLGICVGATLEIRDITEHARILELTERYNTELANQVEEKTAKIREIQNKTIVGIASMVESRDMSTGGHVKRTSDVVGIFAKKLLSEEMGLTKRFLELVIRSAPMHDIGKIGVDDAVLRKQGKFTPEEYMMMKQHAPIGGKMVMDILSGVEEPDFVTVAFNVANYHHEKVNGRGYPEGLKGKAIPIEARIMALADVFDALVSKRCYKEAFSYEEAFTIIRQEKGSHFDEQLADVFLKCRPELEAYYDSCEH